MKINMYSVKDVITGHFAAPFLSVSDADAMRKFGDMLHIELKDLPRSRFNDYDLFWLGSFNDESGSVITASPSDDSVFLCHGGDVCAV